MSLFQPGKFFDAITVSIFTILQNSCFFNLFIFSEWFQGVQVMALGAGPAHALYFSCYEQLKVTKIGRVGNFSGFYNGNF
jgi:hypothetical protein